MFSPIFKITNKTLFNLIEVEVAGKVVQLAPLQSDWETRLKQESVVRRIFSLARFSANGLGIDDVAKIVKDEPGRDDKAHNVAMRVGVVGKEKDIQQILNMLNVNRLVEQLAFLAGKFHQGDMGEKELSQINALLSERLVLPNEMGRLRGTGVEGSTSVTPLAVEVPFQIEDLFGWFRNANKNEIHPINKAGVMFYELLRICPYSENNLLTAIDFYQLVLASEGYGLKKIWSIEEEILKNADNFTQAVSSVERNGGELTIWLEFLSKCLSQSAEKAQTKVMNLVGDAPIFNLRDLKDLIDKKLIRKKGKTKGALYVMGKTRSYR